MNMNNYSSYGRSSRNDYHQESSNIRDQRPSSNRSVRYRDEYSGYVYEQSESYNSPMAIQSQFTTIGERYNIESSYRTRCRNKSPVDRQRYYDNEETGYRDRNNEYLEEYNRKSNRNNYESEENYKREYYGDRALDNRHEIKAKNKYNSLNKLKKFLHEFPGISIKEFHECFDTDGYIYSEISDCFIQIDQKVYPREYLEGSDSAMNYADDASKHGWEENDDNEMEEGEDEGLVPLILLIEIKNIFEKHPNGFYLDELPQKYEDMFGRMFDLRSWGYSHLFHFVCSLRCTFRIYCANNKYIIVSASKCDENYDFRALQRTLNELKKIVNEDVEGVDMNDIELIYKKKHGRDLDVSRMGFKNIRGVCNYLDESVTIIRQENGKEKIVRNIKNSSQEGDDETNIKERKQHENELVKIFEKLSLKNASTDQVSTVSCAKVNNISIDGNNNNSLQANAHPRQWSYSCAKSDNKENHSKNILNSKPSSLFKSLKR